MGGTDTDSEVPTMALRATGHASIAKKRFVLRLTGGLVLKMSARLPPCTVELPCDSQHQFWLPSLCRSR